MTITVSYDKVSGYFIGHEATRDLHSAGLTWQEAIAETVDGADAYDRWSALRSGQLAAAQPQR